MSNLSKIYCFRASYEASIDLDINNLPDWLSVAINWQGYRISTLPWIANVARLLGNLNIEDHPTSWKSYLESLGFRNVTPISCEDFHEDTLYC
ncbi:hypothetical protein M595_3109 [Lyngbya aestuarii BL J]|uniref:Uncharacterized protein n=1 Tax=Lyngbya aestuarii BL J TaxID=1348334 RepID=U7QIR9_9CYAN|nr:hypothetical protein [Lyngbya aestuarii]ERT06960.1 hypothetical protein M595_3109 [Lyngbya aestuarii BL J]